MNESGNKHLYLYVNILLPWRVNKVADNLNNYFLFTWAKFCSVILESDHLIVPITYITRYIYFFTYFQVPSTYQVLWTLVLVFILDVAYDYLLQAINELGEKQNWPLEFVDGSLEELFISVPWSSLLKDSSYIEVRGLKITLQPKQRNDCGMFWTDLRSFMLLFCLNYYNKKHYHSRSLLFFKLIFVLLLATSMFESMWSSMTNSMQLAEECMKQDPSSTQDAAQPLEVIERFAQTIDSSKSITLSYASN